MLGYFELILTFIQTKLHFKPAAICNRMSLTLYHCCKVLVSPHHTSSYKTDYNNNSPVVIFKRNSIRLKFICLSNIIYPSILLQSIN